METNHGSDVKITVPKLEPTLGFGSKVFRLATYSADITKLWILGEKATWGCRSNMNMLLMCSNHSALLYCTYCNQAYIFCLSTVHLSFQSYHMAFIRATD